MVAPPGPMRAEAVTFILLKPLAGACTMTCTSTVSPRAPDKLMTDVVAGSSVLPTRTRPDSTQTGNGAETVAPADSLRSCASGAMKVLRVANTISTTAANTKLLNRQRVPCASCQFRKLNLVRMPMVLLSPRLVHGLDGAKKTKVQPSSITTPKEKSAAEALSLVKLPGRRGAARPRPALAETRVGLSPARRLQAFVPRLHL